MEFIVGLISICLKFFRGVCIIDSYKDFSKIYDACGVNEYSLTFGRSMLKFFKQEHSNELFNTHLDFCCGTGTLCNFFYNNGIDTKGVDISENMLNVAKDKFPEINFICKSVSEFNDGCTYDFITCVDDALNHIIGEDLFEQVIRNASALLRSGGYFIFDLNNPDSFKYDEFITKGVNDNSKLEYYITRPSENSMNFDVNYYVGDELIWKTSVFEQMYSVDYVKEVLKNEGFSVELCTTNFYDDTREIKWKYIARKI